MSSRGLLALGRALARTGVMAKIAFGVAGVTILVTTVLAFVVARSDASMLDRLPTIASNLLAWGAGVMLAFGASARALRRDRDEGVVGLCRLRGWSDVAYLWARVGGLATELFSLVGGGTIVVGAVATLLAHDGGVAARTLETLLGALLFSLAFAVVLAPVAMATLGARSKLGGYLVLVTVLALPELAKPWTAEILPVGWGELGSIPGAMMAVRAAVAPAHVDVAACARAVAVLALIVVIALLALRVELVRLEGEPPRLRREARA